MTANDWIVLAIIAVLCLLVVCLLFFKPEIPWRSTQRWRAPEQSEDEVGEPTPAFRRICRILAVVVLVVCVLCVIGPLMPELTK